MPQFTFSLRKRMAWSVIGYILFMGCSTSESNISDDIIVDNPPLGEYTTYYNAKSLPIPDSLSFAGELVPLLIPDVRERLDRELHINTYWHNNTIFLIKKANRWLPQIEPILKKFDVPDDFKYLTAIEGSFRNDISPKNAVGFWQFRKEAGKEFGLEITKEVDERYDPLKSTEAACKYLKKAYEKFGSWTLVAASYNRGMSGLQKAIDNQKVTSYYDLMLNEETSRYVFRILAIKEIIENPSKYNFEIEGEHLYQPEQLKYVEVTESIDNLVTFAKSQNINYKLLKRHNPWLQKDKLTVKKGAKYQIAIPIN
ncbi:MAG: lytic transglycosylase domain-containing protein [Cyclobacteriaceae bacterium]|nr:lytic transglycosylase domain-containing protein [Cyclobacteriaceae bacterium]